ncbi:MAG: thioredoxin [Candidatus Aminicenantes bacterium RBG_13_63_10]|nr:MAG: thioredoxin [Candidatus Aminicenantes bacterium RBG_13_63_10]
MSILQEVSDSNFEKQVLTSNIPVVVDFWAPWCGPCLMLAPILESLAAKMNGLVKVVRLNTDESFSLARNYGIMAIPTLIVFKDGKEAHRLTGFHPEDELEAWVRTAVEAEAKAC